MTKAEIRKVAAVQRKWLSEAQIEDYSERLLVQFSSLDLSAVSTIHLFLPITEKKEPDTFLFIDWLSLHHPAIKIIVPKADFDTALMVNYVYKGKEGLIKNLYNILEPAQGELHTGVVDMVLIPMLAFDLRGYRVGYGKGFYDRFLQNIVTKKVGLCFFDPVEQISDVNEHDICLDFCITPTKVYSF
ncbi:MAG: 5-formyltetrahydrofolate cyclo-ligase [Candidatus Pedobacter colombiensis]|uniref:5-formyltetrahydrofolate cyclo-ligase n=1 Tax=Candidatus Pedobacter colombiensis TaxID=3121371 RepID=A0AAJ6B6K7_9SPHI|nr:5-formyltetrahydrofolate cyclo-ligase [Pedobacter sp.]WEK19305.1 MAG: 5-formyltetrahydrofolate cyclo-ligase [Pedobacter sp.]